MQYAFVNGKRLKPFPRGKGICPQCKKEVFARCGEINIWHWAHQQNCDPWSEPETAWHLEWKDNFPEDWQEVTIEDQATGATHRSDIQTPTGLVIEFQNSSISSFEIQERERFYKDMIWVVNAIDFKDNFRISSLVKRKLRDLKSNVKDQEQKARENFEKSLTESQKQLSLLKRDLSSIEYDLKKTEDEFYEHLEYLSYSRCISEIINKYLKAITSYSDNSILSGYQCYPIIKVIIEKLEKEAENQGKSLEHLTLQNSKHIRPSVSIHIEYLLKDIEMSFLEDFIRINISIQSLHVIYSNLQNRINYLLELPESDFIPTLKVIPFDCIEHENLLNIICVEIESKFTLFPVMYEMNEERLAAFALYSKHKKYEFLLDIKPEIEKIERELNSIANTINRDISVRDNQMSTKLSSFIENWISRKARLTIR
ncbi:MAG: competence protein CoiA [Prochlorotrichaceae cyanobacterium]